MSHEEPAMSDDTVRLRPPPHGKVISDEQGHSVWSGTVETLELELVTTQSLKLLLESEQAGDKDAIQRIASGRNEGFLARDSATGHFQIIADDDLQLILNQQHKVAPVKRQADALPEPQPTTASEDDDELSLVSTQALRKILGEEPDKSGSRKKTFTRDEVGGFDPYNTR
jgi:hypothetical protein